MKILVTVGTTSFNGLLKVMDGIAKDFPNYCITVQTADSSYVPENCKTLRYVGNINDYYHAADVIVTHAGAGTVYTLLEMKKRFLVVPNMERKDLHQVELAKYLENNRYAKVAWELSEIQQLLQVIETAEFASYKKEEFFMYDEILRLI